MRKTDRLVPWPSSLPSTSHNSLILQGLSNSLHMLETLYSWEELLNLPVIPPFQTLITLSLFCINSLPLHCKFHQSRGVFIHHHTVTPCLEHCELSVNICWLNEWMRKWTMKHVLCWLWQYQCKLRGSVPEARCSFQTRLCWNMASVTCASVSLSVEHDHEISHLTGLW